MRRRRTARAAGSAFADREAVDLREHLAYLHGATVRIGGHLEADVAVQALCESAVPRLADLAVTYLLDAAVTDEEVPGAEDAPMRQAALAATEGTETLVSKVTVAALTGPFAETMATGQPALSPGAGDCLGGIFPPGWSGFLLVVPLRVEHRTLGFTALLRAPQRGAFDDTDLLTATLMADQAALSVHNAHLYQREAHIADELQRSMLPKHPPALPGVEIAHRYLPGNPAAQVGGDWFDAIPLPGSRVALIVGDVMGHGIRSAAAMGQLRTAARTLAALDPPPDQVLRHLDDLAQQLTEHHLATCVYCVYDPVARTCAIANAGHIPPVIVHPDGRAELLPVPAGGPVGLGGVAFETVEVEAADGGLVVLCTDGLVESRDRDLGDGLATLLTSLSGSPPPLDELCEKVLRALHIENREDDVALLAARFHGIPTRNVACWNLTSHPHTPARVRRLIRRTLDDWGLPEHSDVTELLATELVTNAMRYTSRPIGVRLMRAGALLCEVTDDDHHLPVLREPCATEEGGRGLCLVSNLARRWGASRTSFGKAVWFEVATESGGTGC